MPFKSEKQRRYLWATKPEVAKKLAKKEQKLKQETRVKSLIKKMVREKLAGRVSLKKEGLDENVLFQFMMGDPRAKIDAFYAMQKEDPNYIHSHIAREQAKIKKLEKDIGKKAADKYRTDKFWNQNFGGEHNVSDYVKLSKLAKDKNIDIEKSGMLPPEFTPTAEKK